MSCRICGGPARTVLDFGEMPLANRLRDSVDAAEPRFPLALEYCSDCGNLQLGYCAPENDLYDDYLYVTPASPSLEAHYDALVARLLSHGGGPSSFLFEFGSNVGRFLERARPSFGRILGLDPSRAIVDRAVAAGIPTDCAYFGPDVADRIATAHARADFVVARHCAAHNADPHPLVEGARRMLEENGLFAMENAYGLNTVLNREFGQIYHEHMFYFTARPVQRLFAAHGLDLIDLMMAENIHGGSMVFLGAPTGTRPIHPVVEETIARERAALENGALEAFATALAPWRGALRALLDDLRRRGRTVALYGASAKAATLVAAVGVDVEDVAFCADGTDVKIGRYMPGTRIRIRSEEDAIAAHPDYFLITAWNYTQEIMRKVRAIDGVRTGFLSPFPEVAILEPCAADRMVADGA